MRASFWKSSEYAKENHETGQSESKTSILLRYYRVFNIEQCEGLKALYGDDRKPVNPIEQCESITNRMPNGPRIEQHSQAFYRPSADMVGMPSRGCFESPEGYYSTLFHELTHSTGHKSRLNRFEEHSADHQFGSESYSKEELVAEMGAAFLCAIAEIANEHTDRNTTAYIQNWISKLEEDNRLMVHAAANAQKAVDSILGSTFTEEAEEDAPNVAALQPPVHVAAELAEVA